MTDFRYELCSLACPRDSLRTRAPERDVGRGKLELPVDFVDVAMPHGVTMSDSAITVTRSAVVMRATPPMKRETEDSTPCTCDTDAHFSRDEHT